jgi:RND family efflux transporter MFP subunit
VFVVPHLVRNLLIPVCILAAAGLVAMTMINSRGELPRRENAATPPKVITMSVEPGPVDVRIRSRGIVTPRRAVELVSEVNGTITWADPEFLLGSEVTTGQLLLKLDPLDYEVAVSDAQSSLASAELALQEATVLVQKAAIAEAQARVVAARDRLRQARADLASTEIRAPFNAVVDTKLVDLGLYVTVGTALTKLLSTDIAEVRLPILPSDIGFLRTADNQPLTLSTSFGNERVSWEGRLARVEQRVDAETRVFFGVAQVEHPYDRQQHTHVLAHGLFVEAAFEGAPVANAVRLPRSAVHKGTHVFLVNNDTLVRREVTVARREGDSVLVSDGLSAGDQVVLSRLDLMVEGMSVAVSN